MSEPITGITIECSQREEGGKVWWWIGGETYPHREMLKLHGARFSKRRRSWYWIGETLPTEIQSLADIPTMRLPDIAIQPEVERQILAVLAKDDARENGQVPVPVSAVEEPPERPAIRISKPVSLPQSGELDAVQMAIREAKADPMTRVRTAAASITNGRLARIGHAFCGEMAGSITGEVFCYGYAVYDGVAIYINMAGPRMAVEAIRAKLSKGQHVTLVPPDAPSIELTAGEGNTGVYHAYLQYLPEARFASLILLHNWVVTPNYGGKSTTFIFRTSDEQATAKLRHHVIQLVSIPVFDTWSTYLYYAEQKAMLVRKTRSAGGIDLWSVDLDVDA